MTRKLAPGKLVIASHNAGKLREIGALLAPYGIEAISAATVAGGIRLGVPPPKKIEETRRPGDSAASCAMSASNAAHHAA